MGTQSAAALPEAGPVDAPGEAFDQVVEEGGYEALPLRAQLCEREGRLRTTSGNMREEAHAAPDRRGNVLDAYRPDVTEARVFWSFPHRRRDLKGLVER